MHRAEFKLKIITPMFMAGSDGKTPELRPTEFKGMMRFWWRTIRADDNIEELRKDEAKIFGGSGEEQRKSKVIIKVYPQPSNQFLGTNLKEDFGLQWRYNRNINSLEGRDAGIGYLLYSTVLPHQKKKYIKANFQFNIELSSYYEESFKNALASLWAAIYLGGFGTRARRGGGNIIVEAINGSANELDFVPKGNTTNEVFKWLISNLNKCFSIINNGNPKNFCTKYSNLSFSRIIISNQSFTHWKEVLNDIGKIYAEFRTKHKSEIFDTAVFGLPVMHRNKTKVESKFSERRGSPLLIKIFQLNKKFYWAVLRLTGEFLQENNPLALKKKINDKWEIEKTQKPDYKLIDEFWNNELKNRGKEFVLSQPEILNNIVEKIKTECNPDKIILFGSRARGEAHKNADIDIAVENPKNPISSIGAPLDIVDLTKANPNLKDEIKLEGVTIYERKS
jgi:CRISPR-associated protein Cmr1